jgi:hypothetical protein
LELDEKNGFKSGKPTSSKREARKQAKPLPVANESIPKSIKLKTGKISKEGTTSDQLSIKEINSESRDKRKKNLSKSPTSNGLVHDSKSKGLGRPRLESNKSKKCISSNTSKDLSKEISLDKETLPTDKLHGVSKKIPKPKRANPPSKLKADTLRKSSRTSKNGISQNKKLEKKSKPKSMKVPTANLHKVQMNSKINKPMRSTSKLKPEVKSKTRKSAHVKTNGDEDYVIVSGIEQTGLPEPVHMEDLEAAASLFTLANLSYSSTCTLPIEPNSSVEAITSPLMIPAHLPEDAEFEGLLVEDGINQRESPKVASSTSVLASLTSTLGMASAFITRPKGVRPAMPRAAWLATQQHRSNFGIDENQRYEAYANQVENESYQAESPGFKDDTKGNIEVAFEFEQDEKKLDSIVPLLPDSGTGLKKAPIKSKSNAPASKRSNPPALSRSRAKSKSSTSVTSLSKVLTRRQATALNETTHNENLKLPAESNSTAEKDMKPGKNSEATTCLEEISLCSSSTRDADGDACAMEEASLKISVSAEYATARTPIDLKSDAEKGSLHSPKNPREDVPTDLDPLQEQCSVASILRPPASTTSHYSVDGESKSLELAPCNRITILKGDACGAKLSASSNGGISSDIQLPLETSPSSCISLSENKRRAERALSILSTSVICPGNDVSHFPLPFHPSSDAISYGNGTSKKRAKKGETSKKPSDGLKNGKVDVSPLVQSTDPLLKTNVPVECRKKSPNVAREKKNRSKAEKLSCQPMEILQPLSHPSIRKDLELQVAQACPTTSPTTIMKLLNPVKPLLPLRKVVGSNGVSLGSTQGGCPSLSKPTKLISKIDKDLSDEEVRYCFNCQAAATKSWRRSKLYPEEMLCNPCGL